MIEATTKEQEAALRMATAAEITSIYHTMQHSPSYISTGSMLLSQQEGVGICYKLRVGI